MQTLGSIIQEAREKKGLSISDISAKTNIIPKYIEAIEDGAFDVLPGEIYVKGFLRIISTTLELDTNQILSLYRGQDDKLNALENNKLLEESTNPIPVPQTTKKTKEKPSRNTNKKTEENNLKIEEDYSKQEQELLLKSSKKSIKIKKSMHILPIVIFLLIVSILTIIGINVYKMRGNITSVSSKISGGDSSKKRNIVDSYVKIGVRVGDIIYFKPIGLSATIEFIEIGNNVKAIINDLEVTFSKTNALLADLNKNGIDDFRIQLIDIIEDVAMIEIEKIDESKTNNDESIFYNATNNSINNTENQLDSSINIVDGDMYILKNVQQSPIVVECSAKRFVYIRYFVDNDKPNTTNLSSGKNITITANEVIMLTIGNASEVVLKINGKNVVLGNQGETVNKTIKWIKNPDNSTMFDLIVTDTK